MAKSLSQATKKPANIGNPVPAPANPGGGNVPPVSSLVTRELPGLASATLGPVAPVWTTAYDSVKQFYRPGTSQQRIPPLPTKSNPQINAQAASVASAIVAASKTAAAATAAAFVQNMPINELAITNYVVKISDLASLDTFSNDAGGTIVLPGPSLGPGQFIGNNNSGGFGSSASPAGFAFFAGAVISVIATESDLPGVPDTTPSGSGWTAIDAGQNGDYASVYSKLIPAGAFATTYPLGVDVSWTDSLLFFGNCKVVPSAVQNINLFSGGLASSQTCSASFAKPVTAGNAILVVVSVTANPYDSIHDRWNYSSFTVSDGINFYSTIGQGTFGQAPGDGVQEQVYFAYNVVGGTTTVTVDMLTPAGDANGGCSITAYEISLGTTNILPSGFPAGWYCYLQNTGTGTFTVQSTALIDGLSTPITLGPNQGTIVAFDGTNWFTERGIGGSSITFPISVADGGTGTSTPALIAGANITITGSWPDQTITASEGAGANAISFWAYPLSSGEANVANINPVSSNNMNFSANTVPMYYIHIDDFLTVANFTFHVTVADSTAGHNYDWGMYNLSGELIWNLGATSFPSTGVVTTPFAQGKVTIVPGNYWLAFTGNHTGLEFDGITASQLAEFWFLAFSGSTPWWQSVTPSTGGTLTGLSPVLPTTPTATSLTNASVHSYGGQGIIPVIALST
jgi:hypothetical protein